MNKFFASSTMWCESKIASPLNKHLNNTDKEVLLSDDARDAFETLKIELTNMDNILSLPDFEIPFILETDASDTCIGAALIQRIEGKDLPIAFYSRSMKNAEKNYDTSQKELLAVVKSPSTHVNYKEIKTISTTWKMVK